jgi:hypothetical protein
MEGRMSLLGFVLIMACIGALYQWRHTDFVHAILVTLKWGVATVAVLTFVFFVWAVNAGYLQHLPGLRSSSLADERADETAQTIRWAEDRGIKVTRICVEFGERHEQACKDY